MKEPNQTRLAFGLDKNDLFECGFLQFGFQCDQNQK